MTVLSGPQDGYGFEREFCEHAFIDVDRRLRRGKWHGFREEVKRVKSLQDEFGWDPKRPKTLLAQCLFHCVASGLNRKGGDLFLFVAIGTKLDLAGVDCFFQYGDRIATFDLTVSQSKKHLRANFLIQRDQFIRDEHYEIGRLIAQKLSLWHR